MAKKKDDVIETSINDEVLSTETFDITTTEVADNYYSTPDEVLFFADLTAGKVKIKDKANRLVNSKNDILYVKVSPEEVLIVEAIGDKSVVDVSGYDIAVQSGLELNKELFLMSRTVELKNVSEEILVVKADQEIFKLIKTK
jgi:hypothetical protein